MLSRVQLGEKFPVFRRFASLPLPLHGSHRGGRHWGRENTLETYRRAVEEAQTDILEIDLWRSGDDHLVLNHDGIVNGVSVKGTTLKQLQQLDPELITVNRLLGSSSLSLRSTLSDDESLQMSFSLVHRWSSSST